MSGISVQVSNDQLHPTYTVVRDGGLVMEVDADEVLELIAALVTGMTDPLRIRNSRAFADKLEDAVDPFLRDGIEPVDVFAAMRGQHAPESRRVVNAVLTVLRRGAR